MNALLGDLDNEVDGKTFELQKKWKLVMMKLLLMIMIAMKVLLYII